jgi:PAS domain S-box-containing protein
MQARFSAIVHSSLDCIVTIDDRGRVTEWNPAAEQTFGFRREEMLGTMLHERVMLPQDAVRHVAALQRLAEGGEPRMLGKRIEMRAKRKDGAVIDIELAITRGNHDGPVQYMGFVRDVTSRKAAEEKVRRRDEFLAALMRNSSDAVHIVDANGIITFTTESASRVVGWEVPEMIGKPGADFVHPDDVADAMAGLQDVAVNPGEPRTQIMRIKHKTLGWRWMECVAANHLGDATIAGIVVNFRDVTERHKQEQALRESHRKLVQAQRIGEVGSWELDLQTQKMTWSEQTYRIFGRDPATFGADFDEINNQMHPEDKHAVLDEFARAIAENRPHEVEHRIVLPDGSIRYVLEHCEFLPGPDGKPRIATGTCQDVTSRRLAEQELRERDEFLGALLDHAGHGVQIMDERGYIKWASESIESVTGSKPIDWIGRHGSDVTYAQDAPACEAALQRLVQNPRGIEYLTVRVACADKSFKWVDVIATNRLSEPAIRGFVVNFYDATRRMAAEAARLESEQRYSKLMHYSNDAVVLADRAGRTTFASPAIEQITGYALDDFMRLNYSEHVHEADQPKLREVMAKVLASSGVPHRTTHRFRRRDGSWAWVENTTTNWMHEPAIGAIVINVRDVSERISLQEQLTHASKMEGIGRLAGGVAHDFNNLLTAIIGYAQLLEARLESDSVSNAQAQRIMDAAGRATDLTRQLLAFSRRQILQPAPLNLNSRVEGMESLLRHIIGEDIELKIVEGPDLALTLADPTQIDQVIMNLAVNARDAMPRGGRLLIETSNVYLDTAYADAHPEVTPGDYVMIAVSDNGVGMDAATRARVFEPFFTTKGPGRGTGLGLAMVYGIVRQSGGHIWLYSEPDKGSVFKIYMPATRKGDEYAPPAPSVVPSGGVETILLAEDEASVRVLVSEVLSQAGYRVLAAPSGADALKLMEGVDIRLLLTDVVMPGMSGSELAKQVAAVYPDIKVIYMSGYTDDAIVDHGTLVSGVEFLQKPFSPTVLLRRVREVLDSK